MADELPEMKYSEVVSTAADHYGIFLKTEEQAKEVIRRAKAYPAQLKRIGELEDEKELLLKDLIKYGVHLGVCRGKEKCLCGFDEVKEQALRQYINPPNRVKVENKQNQALEKEKS